MTVIPHRSGTPDEFAAAVHAAAECFALLWSRSADSASERVSAPQLRALTTVAGHPDINVSGLAAELNAIPSSASRLCDRLVAAGLLVREQSEHNRREVSLRVTRDGQRLLDEVGRRRREDIGSVLAAMTPAQREALLDGLVAFRAAVDMTPSERLLQRGKG